MKQEALFEYNKNVSTPAMVEQIKSFDQDYEWYPTTPEILSAIKTDLAERFQHEGEPTILDCGAGDGRALVALTKNARYAIEKSEALLQSLDRSIFIVGTDFHQQALIDKKVDVVFSNPPYSEYVSWVTKLVREANARHIYLVIPKRWRDNELIKKALDARSAQAHVIGKFDFFTAERQANTHVEIVRIDLTYRGHGRSSQKVDAFDLWFKENFKLDIANRESSKFDWKKQCQTNTREALSGQLVKGNDLISALEELYRGELAKLMGNYQSLGSIDPALLNELNVNID